MKSYIYSLIPVLLMMLTHLPAKAQNNPYKINDSLYTIYRQAVKYGHQPQGLQIADSLYHLAETYGDPKAQCIALTVPVAYYMDTNDSLYFVNAVKRLQEESRKKGYLQYYYYAANNHIIWLLNRGQSLAALHYSEKMKNQALKDQHAYGLYSCIRTQGHIYSARGDEEMGMRCYKEALEYAHQYLPEQDPSQLYTRLAEYYRVRKPDSLDVALAYAEKAIREGKTYANRMGGKLEKCLILYAMKEEEGFLRFFKDCLREMEENGVVQRRKLLILQAYRWAVEGDYPQAYEWAGKLIGNNRYAVMMDIARRSGDYKRALAYCHKQHRYRDSVINQVQSSDLAEMTIILDNQRIKQEAKDLELENTELELANTRIIMFSLCACLGLLGIYFYNRNRLIKTLNKTNRELTIARDRAEQAVKIKTTFIQNMTHEIRTPLNAIVGFSQVLTTPGIQVPEEEKKECDELIRYNTDLLTTLISDVLDISDLESGKYTMELAPCRCNDMCRAALASVAFRAKKNVAMSFTTEVNDDYQVVSNDRRLQQVLVNFLTNAEKYTDKGEIHLHCSLAETPGKITFSVSDTGTGIPADKVKFIFDRFYKVDAFKQGMGLGLTICRLIADRLDGEVKYDSSYTHGARFLFILPLSPHTYAS